MNFVQVKTKSRITSILNANNLDYSITGLQTFNLSSLILPNEPEFELPTNLRLGHLAERIVSELFKRSTNYKVFHENIQVIENKKTIGEIDFIIEETETKQLTHLELAYKFYLYDPKVSSTPINNWIGPNRNDSLQEKLEKLKKTQFPLLYHNGLKSTLDTIAIEEVSQALCLLVSLFIPYEYKGNFNPIYQKAIVGYYLNFETFHSMDNSSKTYYLPPKKEWGINPSENETWTDFSGVKEYIVESLKAKKAPLCWQNYEDSYTAFFIVWW